jgi:hypothetical protein
MLIFCQYCYSNQLKIPVETFGAVNSLLNGVPFMDKTWYGYWASPVISRIRNLQSTRPHGCWTRTFSCRMCMTSYCCKGGVYLFFKLDNEASCKTNPPTFLSCDDTFGQSWLQLVGQAWRWCKLWWGKADWDEVNERTFISGPEITSNGCFDFQQTLTALLQSYAFISAANNVSQASEHVMLHSDYKQWSVSLWRNRQERMHSKNSWTRAWC